MHRLYGCESAMEEKECYIFRCEKYPHCKKAKGKCCAIDFDAEIPRVREGECTKGNGYPLFEDDGRRFFNPDNL